jgi:hypothetical protein
MPTSLTREQLYKRVWTEPIDRLCKEFGVSNVGLGKVCVRHGIPVPPRGYWAKVLHGHRVRRPPLTERGKGIAEEIEFGARPVAPYQASLRADEEVHPLIGFERRPENAIAVPDTLRATHPLVRATRSYWKALRRCEVNLRDNTVPHLNIRVSKPAVPRALRLMHALLSACDSRGLQTSATSEGKTIVNILGVALELSLRERLRQQQHEPTAKEIADAKRWSWSRPPKFDQVHSGDFELKIENVWGVRHSWSDRRRQRLEETLNEVLEGLIRAALLELERQAQRERERAEREKAEKRRAEAELRRREERARARRFDALIDAADDYDRATAFLTRLREAIGPVVEDSDLGRWLGWVAERVERLDPLRRFRDRETTIELYFPVHGYELDSILRHGLRDAEPPSGQEQEDIPSVTVYDAPMTYGPGSTYVAVRIPEDAVLAYEDFHHDREGIACSAFRRECSTVAVWCRGPIRESVALLQVSAKPGLWGVPNYSTPDDEDVRSACPVASEHA